MSQLELVGIPVFRPISDHPQDEPWKVRISEHIVVHNVPPMRRIYVDHRLHMEYRLRTKSPEERMALVLLVEQGISDQRQLAKAFGIHYNTLNNWVADYRKEGMRGLFPAYPNQTMPPHPASEPNVAEPERTAVDISQETLFQPQDEAEEMAIAEASISDVQEEPQVAMPSRYVGLLLMLPFLQAMLQPLFDYLRQTSRRFHSKEKMWAVWDLLQVWALLIFQGVENPEQTKSLVHPELGALFGRRRAPSCKTLRRSWPLLVANGLPQVSAMFLARRLIRLGYVTLGTIFVDGHFVPYFGKNQLSKGWWPQRRSVHRGHYQHWANDVRGRPIFCLMHQAYTYFGDIIPEMVCWLRKQMHAVGSVVPLILVFDRGAFSGPLFSRLDKMKVGWITYRKGSEEYPEKDFTHCTWVAHEAGSVRRVEYCHKTVTLDTYEGKDISAIALRDADTGRQITVICNDAVITEILGRPMTDREKITTVMSRWKQENYFRQSKENENIDGVLGYHFGQAAADTTRVPNPAHAKQVERIEALEKAVNKHGHKRELMAVRYESLKCKPSWDRYVEQTNNQKIIARHESAKKELAAARKELDTIPETATYAELKPRDIATMDFARQQVMMSLRIAVYHARLQLRDLIAKHHSDHREIGKVLARLVKGGGTYTTGINTDIVTLTRPEQPRFQRTAERLIEELNAMGPKTLGDGTKDLVFRLEDPA